MTKIKIALLVIILTLGELSLAAKEILPSQEPDSSPINMSEPPFWMSSYDEFKDLQDSQKSYYLEKLLSAMEKVPALKTKTKEDLTEASEWYQSWNQIRKKIYEYCQDQTVLKTCEDIADIRLQALDMFANQKLENREPDREK